MAKSYHVQPPEPFTFSRPEEWEKWIRRFEQFRQASGLDKKDEAIQISTLVYSMGDEADDILCSCKLTAEAMRQYTMVKEALASHFIQRRNVIFERAKFNSRRQEPGESVDAFITSLYALAEHCGYGELHDEMIQDRIVVGIINAKLSEKLQLDAELTLEKAVTQAHQAETVRQQQPLVRGEGQVPVSVGAVNHKGKGHPRSSSGDKSAKHTTGNDKRQSCSRCGKRPYHELQNCPAKNAVCRQCNKRGHYKAVCRTNKSGKVQQVTEESESDAEDWFLGAVGDNDPGESWTATLLVNKIPIDFHIDTGAEVTLISQSAYKAIGSPPLFVSRKNLKGPSGNNLPVDGWFHGTLATRCPQQCETKQEVYVIGQLSRCLLGQPAIRALDLVHRVRGISNAPKRVIDNFPQLFKGLGKMEGEYSIQLEEGAKPFALTAPRRVPVPLMKAVRTELQRMQDLGVITQVTEPTDWCAGMVVVPKKNKDVRICVDLTQLNRSVKRERHVLPAVDQTLAQIAGAKVFSKLDANSGFWQIPLSTNLIKLTTFITPFGRFAFRRLPFGITSAPEHFQRRMTEILSGIEGVVCMMDDTLVYGASQEEHDEHLQRVLHRLQEAGVTLNRQKCMFSVDEVTFLGACRK